LGVCVLFADLGIQSSLHIRARGMANSVLMAKLLGVAVGANVAQALEFQEAIVHTDCREALLQLKMGETGSLW